MERIILFVSICLLTACQQESKNMVVISGKIKNPVSEIASIFPEDRSQTYRDSITNDGNFEIQFKIDASQYMYFMHGKETTAMYVKPGDKIQLSIDPNEFDESINYTGSNASNFLAKSYLIDENIDRVALFSLSEKEFLANVLAIEKDLNDILKYVIEDSFVAEQKKLIWFNWANAKLNYKNYHEYVTETSIELSDTYYDFTADIDMNDTTLLNSSESYRFLTSFISSQTSNENEILETLKFIRVYFDNQKIKDQLSFNMLDYFIKNETLNNIQPALEEFKLVHSDSSKYNELSDLALEMKKFNPGQPSINFTYPDIKGNQISLSDFNGSYVYVDVWATWCGPCKKEIPYLAALEEEYHDQNIVFLSVSIDEEEDKQDWMKMIEEKEMGGVQLFASGWSSQITKDYKINGIPRFMLFDTEGNILNVRATRPSDPNTRKLFDNILMIKS